MGVESRRDKEDFGTLRLKCREADVRHRRAKRLAAAARGQRHVVHVRPRRLDAGVGIERILESADHHHARVGGKDLLGAVAVMHVEVDHGCPLEPMRERMRHADGDAVEQAEAHGATAFGVVSGWPHGAERGTGFAAQHEIGPEHDRPGSMPRRVERVRVHGRVRIEVMDARFRARRLDHRDVVCIMYAHELLRASRAAPRNAQGARRVRWRSGRRAPRRAVRGTRDETDPCCADGTTNAQ